jgi:hypothetical protein
VADAAFANGRFVFLSARGAFFVDPVAFTFLGPVAITVSPSAGRKWLVAIPSE